MIAGSNWPISVLGSAFGPHLDARKLNMAICVGYLEANEQDVPATLTVTGLVSPKASWQSFEERWPRALRAEGLSAFSARDLVHGAGEFSSRWIDDASRREHRLTHGGWPRPDGAGRP